jgi:hypothetical protein
MPLPPLAQRLEDGPQAFSLFGEVILKSRRVLAGGQRETYFVSFLGTDALAGVALVFPLFMLMTMMSNGGIGGLGALRDDCFSASVSKLVKFRPNIRLQGNGCKRPFACLPPALEAGRSTFAEHDLYPVGPLAVDHDVQGLPGFRYAYFDLLRVHRVLNSVS